MTFVDVHVRAEILRVSGRAGNLEGVTISIWIPHVRMRRLLVVLVQRISHMDMKGKNWVINMPHRLLRWQYSLTSFYVFNLYHCEVLPQYLLITITIARGWVTKALMISQLISHDVCCRWLHSQTNVRAAYTDDFSSLYTTNTESHRCIHIASAPLYWSPDHIHSNKRAHSREGGIAKTQKHSNRSKNIK